MSEAPERRFAAVAARLVSESDVSEGTGFGKVPGLRTGGKIFAMLAHERLVVKLPRERVDALVAAGAAEQFEPSPGRRMKEWASVDPAASEDWARLAAEARAFVARERATGAAR